MDARNSANTEALKEIIIDRLGRGVPERDLLPEICLHHNLDWDEARALVAQVREEHAIQIAEHQLPWRIVLAAIGGAGGLAMLVSGAAYLVEVLKEGERLLSAARFAPANEVNTTLLESVYRTTASDLPAILALIGFGMAMLIGSLLGMRETWRVMIDWLADRLWN